jgi:hypothetical protein
MLFPESGAFIEFETNTASGDKVGFGLSNNDLFYKSFNGSDVITHTITAKGDGTQFLSDDGTYKTLYTTTEIDSKLGDINTILESIING